MTQEMQAKINSRSTEIQRHYDLTLDEIERLKELRIALLTQLRETSVKLSKERLYLKKVRKRAKELNYEDIL